MPNSVTKRTQDEIDAEIAKLEGLKTRIPQKTLFGDNNRAAIDAEIVVLKEQMSMNDVYRNYGADMHVCDSALGAFSWMAGEVDTPTSDDWSALVD